MWVAVKIFSFITPGGERTNNIEPWATEESQVPKPQHLFLKSSELNVKPRALGVGRVICDLFGRGTGSWKGKRGFSEDGWVFLNNFSGVCKDRRGVAIPSRAHLESPPPGTRFVWRFLRSLGLAERPTMKQIQILIL